MIIGGSKKKKFRDCHTRHCKVFKIYFKVVISHPFWLTLSVDTETNHHFPPNCMPPSKRIRGHSRWEVTNRWLINRFNNILKIHFPLKIYGLFFFLWRPPCSFLFADSFSVSLISFKVLAALGKPLKSFLCSLQISGRATQSICQKFFRENNRECLQRKGET